MSAKLEAMLSDIETLLSAAKKKPKHAVEKVGSKWRVRSMKDGKLWPQTYDSKAMANKGLAAYHLRKKGVPPKKTKAAVSDGCPECGAETKLDMSGKSCHDCGWNDQPVSAASEVTDDMIRQLMDDAGEHGDMEQVELCKLALQGDDAAYAKCVEAIESAKAMAAAECPECSAEMHEGECSECGCKTEATFSASAEDKAQKKDFKSNNPLLFSDKNHDFYRVKNASGILPYLKGTPLARPSEIQQYIDANHKLYLLINKKADINDPLSRVFMVGDSRWDIWSSKDKLLNETPDQVPQSLKKFFAIAQKDAVKGDAPVTAGVVRALEGNSYKPEYKANLKKLKRLVDRGYLLSDEVAGAMVEALRQAKVSTRMAVAIANKLQMALTETEEDVIDVTARAKLAAKARK